MIDLSGKAAVVTGGSRGIGRAIALRLAEQGADVCFSYVANADAAQQTAKEIEALGRRSLPVQANVTDPEAAVIEHCFYNTKAALRLLDAMLPTLKWQRARFILDAAVGRPLPARRRTSQPRMVASGRQ